jgi:dodecin
VLTSGLRGLDRVVGSRLGCDTRCPERQCPARVNVRDVNRPHQVRSPDMPDKTYKIIELVGVSDESVQQAIRNAVTRASQSLKGLDWFEMVNVRGLVKDGKVNQFQVTVKVGFRIFSEQEMSGA